MGMRNHEFVPVYLIERIAHMKRSNAYKILRNLLKYKLVEHKGKPCRVWSDLRWWIQTELFGIRFPCNSRFAEKRPHCESDEPSGHRKGIRCVCLWRPWEESADLEACSTRKTIIQSSQELSRVFARETTGKLVVFVEIGNCARSCSFVCAEQCRISCSKANRCESSCVANDETRCNNNVGYLLIEVQSCKIIQSWNRLPSSHGHAR